MILDYAKILEFYRWFAMIAFLDAIYVIPFAWLRFPQYADKVFCDKGCGLFLVANRFCNCTFIFVPTKYIQKLGFRRTSSYPFISNLLGVWQHLYLLLRLF